VDTLEPTLPQPSPGDGPGGGDPDGDGPTGGESTPRKRRLRWWIGGGVVALLVAALITSALVRVPYFTLSPGSVRDTQPLIQVEGHPSYDNEGTVDFTTVSLQRATALQAVIGWLDPAVDVVDEDQILGNQTQEQSRQENLREMTDSKEIATAVALQRLGYEVKTTGNGAVVLGVVPDTPAAQALHPGDVIVAADGKPIALADELVAAIATHQPGDVMVLRVQPAEGGEPSDVSVALVPRTDDPNRAMLGVSTSTRDLKFEFPFTVTIDSGAVGGPSAGLAFTLAVMDKLTSASITGGNKVATTGTIDSQGRVGPVGGVHQKTVAVRRSGAQLFLVPSSELDEARKYAGDLRVEPVDTLDDALRVLATVGGGTEVITAPTPVTTGN